MNRTSVSLFLLLMVISCDQNSRHFQFNYGTDNDFAREYFLAGWKEIMDFGRWTEAEMAFRKAAEIDPDCLLCMSLVGRITQDLTERQKILQQLKVRQNEADPDEKMLLEVNMMSLEAANQRDQGIKPSDDLQYRRRHLAEENFGRFARKFPTDSYFKAEYIEFLHLNHGASTALDTLKTMASETQLQLGFYISYQAVLEMELGRLSRAKELSAKLDSMYLDFNYPSPVVLKARIAKAEKDTIRARKLLAQAIDLDPNHMIAQSLFSSIANASYE